MAKVSNLTGEDVKDAAPAKTKKEEAPPTPFNFEGACEYAVLIEEQQDKIDEIMDAAKEKAAPIRETIASFYKSAADDGVTRKVLKHVLSKRHNDRKQRAKFAKLSAEHQRQSQQLELNLHDQDFEAAKEDAA